MRTTTPKAAAAAAASLALLLAACGGQVEQVGTDTTDDSGSTATTDGAEPRERPEQSGEGEARLAAAVEQSDELDSGRFTMTMAMADVPDVGDLSFGIEGAFNAEGQSSITMDMGSLMDAVAAAAPEDAEENPFGDLMGGMFDEPIEVVVDGEITYVKMGFLTSMMGVDTEWISSPTEDGEGMTGFGAGGMTDPGEFLEVLRGLDAEVEELGTDEVNGVEATGYRADVDLEAAAELGEADVESLFGTEGAADLSGVTMPMEVWLNEDGFPVRIAMELDGELMGSFDPTGGDLPAGSITITIDFFDIGEPVEIEIPDPADVTSEDEMEDLDPFAGGLGESLGEDLTGDLG